MCLKLPWADIAGIEKRFGMVAAIIDLKTATETHSIRCNGADEFIHRMDSLRGA